MEKYNHIKIEKKWQAYWEKNKMAKAIDDKKPKFYGLIEFPYPSAEGLHVGHIRSNTAMDIICRKRRMQGYNVLYPIGWDAFGLPTENYAIKTGIHPAIVTKKNTDTFRRQLKEVGFSFDWDREINTSDPAYYKWTQWIFLQLLKHNLAYKKKMAINWCPSCKIGLANEEVIDGKCERCGTPVEKKEKEQWMLAITKYADRLDRDLDRKKILIGTRNEAKVKMIKACLAGVKGLELISLNDIPAVDDSDLHEGDDFKENARLKSEFYFKKTGLPTISTDHMLWIEKWPENGGFMVHIRKHANPESERATDEEVINFLINFLKTVGGKSRANFHYAMSYTDENGTIGADEVPHKYILQTERAKHFWPGYPVEALLKDADSGLYKSEQSDDVRYIKIKKVLEERFAPRMLSGRTPIDYLEKIRIQQKNWIGRKEGINITYPIDGLDKTVTVFTTRPDTNYGATFVVLAPENELTLEIVSPENKQAVLEYIKKSQAKSEEERIAEGRKKTGVFTGRYAINHLTGKKMPIWVSDFVLAGFGTGAVVGVPGHDIRDFEFAKEFSLEIIRVVIGKDNDSSQIIRLEQVQEEEGRMVNSGILNGLEIHTATKKIMDFMEEKGWGKKVITYHLRDWIFSRQHYWGEPIPVVFCEKCGTVPIPEKALPLELPKVEKYQPTDTGESPLAAITDWVNTKCPRCGGPAKRETDTMPNWAGSSWYYLRYTDPKNKKAAADFKKLQYWTPVDWYNGGMEHTTLHLLYSRFWHKFLYDIGVAPTSEPYAKRTSHGMILAEGGVKMSKSKGNVINPDEIVKKFGADSLRVYEMFMGPFDQAIAWSTDGLAGAKRFLEKIYDLYSNVKLVDCGGPSKPCENAAKGLPQMLHKTIKKVGEDIEAMKFNTAVSQMMIFMNFAGKFDSLPRPAMEKFLIILAPFAPHLSEELWSELGHHRSGGAGKQSIFKETWPEYNPELVKDETINLVVQVNSKVRDTLEVSADISEEEAKTLALESKKIKKWIEGKEAVKIIFVKGKLVNIVIK